MLLQRTWVEQSTGTIFWDNAGVTPNWAGVLWNPERKDRGTVMVGPDWLTIDPQNHAVLVRWTAPMSGTWDITACFGQGDTVPQPHGIAILRNYATDTPLLSQTISGTTPVYFDFTNFQMDAGETLEFVSYRTGAWGNLSTALSVAVTYISDDTYSAAGEAPLPANPSGTWSYHWSDSFGSPLTLLQRTWVEQSTGTIIWDNAGVTPNWAGVMWNPERKSLGTVMVSPNWLTLAPQLNPVAVRWTAPMAARWDVCGYFGQGDTSPLSHGIAILRNYNVTAPLLNQSFGGANRVYFDFASLQLEADETLEFVVYRTGDWGSLSTALSVIITSVTGDLNCDGAVNFADINPFVLFLANFSTWQATYPGCPPEHGDINGDGTYPSFGDINPFVALLSGGN